MGASHFAKATEDVPLLPVVVVDSVANKAEVETQPQHHALLGMVCVAVSALCFSFMSTFIKYLTFTVTSMEAIFWRSMVACACNFVSFSRLSRVSAWITE
ncbi:hypothetical protein P3T76_009305 [Phytophthora citrophthora]|uniref:Uncharacterized protein n=1 Tax=Phytophthora citrophthora TaxID=4793 RepID=A0AAD9GGF8_9STRA|nr:hypothetical protein P3T76_009305 [Phytophthora citrophthora]